MRSRRRSSRQVVVAHAPLDSTHVMGERLGARPRVTSQPCNPLAPRVVATRARDGWADERADRAGLRRGHAPVGHPIRHGVTHGGLTAGSRTLRPQALGTRAAALTPVTGHAWACLGVHGPPSPWVVRLLRHTAGHGARCRATSSTPLARVRSACGCHPSRGLGRSHRPTSVPNRGRDHAAGHNGWARGSGPCATGTGGRRRA
jgi:hypothetical protein